MLEASADREGVLGNLISGDVHQLETGSGQSCTPSAGSARLNRVRIVDARSAGSEQPQVAVHGVLVERNEQVDPVTHVGDLLRARSNGQKSMAAANDGLIGVVGIQVKAPSTENLCENIARRGDSLTGRSSDTDSKGLLHDPLPRR